MRTLFIESTLLPDRDHVLRLFYHNVVRIRGAPSIGERVPSTEGYDAFEGKISRHFYIHFDREHHFCRH